MARIRIRRVGRLLVIGLVIAAIARAVGRARGGGAGSMRATSGDTWPPVPVNADRTPNQGAWETAATP